MNTGFSQENQEVVIQSGDRQYRGRVIMTERTPWGLWYKVWSDEAGMFERREEEVEAQ